MYTTYHLTSAQEITTDFIEAIKVAFKTGPITITIEEEDQDFQISEDMKNILDERLLENKSDYINSDESIKLLNLKYGL